MLVAQATGVATYARALRRAQQAIGPAALLSGGPHAEPGRGTSRLAKWQRVARALPRWLRTAQARTDALFVVPDLFRTAHAHFTIHGRPLAVRLPGPPGLIHWTYPLPIRVIGWRNLYTVHDVIPLIRPDLTPIDGRRHRRLLSALLPHADRLVTVSEAARDEIVAALGCAPEQVVNGSQPVDVPPRESISPSLLPPDLPPGGYLLVCGSVEPRKNIATILAAHRRSGSPLPLVVAGPDGWRADRIDWALGRPGGLVRLPYRRRDEMLALIAHARALLMPSLAEGFGLPVAEAMALGTPVLTASAGALAETAGDAALLVDPADTSAIADAIAALSTDEPLRARLAEAGLARAARFGFEGFVLRMAALYGEVLASPAD